MKQISITIGLKDEKSALIEGARKLGLPPEELTCTRLDQDRYLVEMKDAPGQFEIFAREDHMEVLIKIITPPRGKGEPVTVEDIEQALADRKIIFGIHAEAIREVVSRAAETGVPQGNITIAVGEPPREGREGRIEIKVGRDAENSDPEGRSMAKQGQILAVRIPAEKGVPGRTVQGRDVPAKDGKDPDFSAGENVTLSKDGSMFTSAVYGSAHIDWKGISVRQAVQIDPDEMWAEMPIIPKLADNSPFTVQDAIAALEQAGVVFGVKEEAIIGELEKGRAVASLRVAEAAPAVDGVDARIDYQFRLNGLHPEILDAEIKKGAVKSDRVARELVFSGDVLATITPAEKPVHGSTVKGKTLAGKDAVNRTLKAGEKVTPSDDGLTFVVREGAVGYAGYSDGTLSVENPVRVPEDTLSAFLTVHPVSGDGKMLTVDLVDKLLADQGITYGIDRSAVHGALQQAASSGVPVFDVVMASGKAPERGEDALIDFKVEFEKTAGLRDARSDTIDFRERASIRNVKAGDVLAVKTPPSQGKEGVNVFGQLLKPEPGKDRILQAADNVALSDDGLVFTSRIDGMVALVGGNRIGVFKLHEIPGDVDYSTGNLSMDGALSIKGWIRKGFSVRASGDIRVGGGIEDATVKAGTNLHVGGGILGSQEGRISARGDVTARFIENARVLAGGNILVRDDVLLSIVSAKGDVIVTEGKGRIRGGSVQAGGQIEVNEIGSQAGIKTLVSVGLDMEIRQRLSDSQKKLMEFARNKAKMDTALSKFAGRKTNQNLPREIGFKLARLTKLRRETALEEARLKALIAQETERLTEAEKRQVSVRVKRVVYSGTAVSIRGQVFQIQEDIHGKVLFKLNPEKQVVEMVR
ncbi:MAG: flagellar assembly protein A [Pseudomonadota bacterium]